MLITKLLRIRSSGLLQATAQSIATGLGGQFLLLISGPLAARILGVDGRGYLAALTAWSGVLAAVGTLGVPAACAYFLSRDSTQPGRTLGEAYRVAVTQVLVLTPALAAILFLWSRGKPLEVEIAIYPALLMVPAYVAYQYALAILQGQQRFRALNAMRLLPAAFYAVSVTALFLLREDRLLVVAVAWVSSYVLASIISTAVALKRTRIDWRGEAGLRGRLLRFGLRGHIGAIAPVDSLRLDQLAASIFLAPAVLGLYIVAYAFTNLPRFVSQSAGMVAYPAIAKQQGSVGSERLMWRYFWGVTLLNSAFSALLIIAMPLLIPLFFGSEFTASVPIAQLLLVGTTFAASRGILVEGLRGLGQPGVSTIAEISMYPWLLTGGAYLMWLYGVTGLAVGVTIGYGLSLVAAVGMAVTRKSKERKAFVSDTPAAEITAAQPVDMYQER